MAKAADSSPTKATSPVASPEKAAETPKDESVKETKKKDEKSDDDGDEVMSKGVLRTKFVEIKDAGNEEYKRKMWVMAIAKFGEGISLYQQHKALCESDNDLKTKIAQLYTNRALSWH